MPLFWSVSDLKFESPVTVPPIVYCAGVLLLEPPLPPPQAVSIAETTTADMSFAFFNMLEPYARALIADILYNYKLCLSKERY